MAHELDFSTGRAGMAYVGDVPWHGLGQQLSPDSDLETWRREAGLDWELVPRPVYFQKVDGTEGPKHVELDDRIVLARNDNGTPLSIVSTGYKVVQPSDVLEFYRDLVGAGGMRLETAGSLRGGRKIWALATNGAQVRVMGQDLLKPYLLLATSCDKTLATTATFTSVRVVCNNTLTFAVDAAERARSHVRVPHSATFDPKLVKAELGLIDASFEHFATDVARVAKRKVTQEEAVEFFVKLYAKEDEEVDLEDQALGRNVKNLLYLFSHGPGSDLRSAQDTAWGLVNAVTRYCDHESGARSNDTRLDSAWFGRGRGLKEKAWNNALSLAA